MKLTKQQVETILKNSPSGTTKESILDGLITRGYELEGVDTELAKKQIEAKKVSIDPKKGESNKSPSYFERIKNTYNEITSGLVKNLTKTGKNYLENAQKGNIGEATKDLLRGGLRTVGAVAESTFTPVTEAPLIKESLDFIGKKLGNTEIAKTLAQKIQDNPEKAQDIIDIVNTIALSGGKIIEKPLEKVTEKIIPNIAEKTISKTGEVIKNTGTDLYKISVPMQEATKTAEKVYLASKPTLIERVKELFTGNKKKLLNKPTTEAETAARIGLVGTEKQLGVQAERNLNKLWNNTVKPALETSKNKTDMKIFLKEIKDEIIANNPVGVRRNQLLKSYQSFSEPFKKVGKISDSKLQTYKEDWAKFIPEASRKGVPIGSTLKEIQDIASKKARTILYNSLGGDVKTAYLDYGNLKSISKLYEKVQDPLRSKGAFKQGWEFILDTALTPIATIGGQVLYRTGQGVEFIGQKGAKKVGDIISKSSGAITTGSLQSILSDIKE